MVRASNCIENPGFVCGNLDCVNLCQCGNSSPTRSVIDALQRVFKAAHALAHSLAEQSVVGLLGISATTTSAHCGSTGRTEASVCPWRRQTPCRPVSPQPARSQSSLDSVTVCQLPTGQSVQRVAALPPGAETDRAGRTCLPAGIHVIICKQNAVKAQARDKMHLKYERSHQIHAIQIAANEPGVLYAVRSTHHTHLLFETPGTKLRRVKRSLRLARTSIITQASKCTLHATHRHTLREDTRNSQYIETTPLMHGDM
jgi:hypothetical protein